MSENNNLSAEAVGNASGSRRKFLGAAGLATIAAGGFASTAAAQQAPKESTYDRILRTKVLRVPVWSGNLPYFAKNLSTGEWFGGAVDMARDLAAVMDNASVEFVEMTAGANSILALQAGQVDLGFALSIMTPTRARSLDFSEPKMLHSFGLMIRSDRDFKKWADINRADVRVAAAIGASDETIVRRMAPQANVVGFKSRPDAFMALMGGKVDCVVSVVLQGLAEKAKNPKLGNFVVPEPVVAMPTSVGVRPEPDTRWLKIVNSWVKYNKALGQMRDWYIAGLEPLGVTADDIPPSVVI